MIPEETLERVVSVIVREAQPEKIVMFGSQASGKNVTDDSDLDLLVVRDGPETGGSRSLGVRKHLRGMRLSIDLLVYTTAEVEKWRHVPGSLVHEALTKGKVLYG